MNLESIIRKLLIKYPFFGSVVANSNFVLDESIKTLETDGENIYYNPSFIESISNEQQIFVFAHEICHIAFNHIQRRKDKDIMTWNLATDAVINAFLKNDGLPLVEGGVDIDDAINYDAEEMYEKLLLDNNQYNFDASSTHSMWNNINKDELEEKISEKEIFKQNKDERKKELNKLKKSLITQALGHGDTTNSEQRIIKDIGTSPALIDWRKHLKEATKFNVDWSYQNAEIINGVITPNLEEIAKPETEILLDTSGSVDEKLLKCFLRECKNILNTSNLQVGCFDTKFYGFNKINDISDIDNLVFMGGGGTNFNVALSSFTNRVENKIIFTDGKSSVPKKSMDIIWIVFGKTKINPLGGKVIYIDEQQLQNLSNYQKKLKL